MCLMTNKIDIIEMVDLFHFKWSQIFIKLFNSSMRSDGDTDRIPI